MILATAPSSKAMSEVIDGLGPNGKLVVVGASFDPIEVKPPQLIFGSKSIPRLGVGNADGCGGHAELFRTDRRASDEIKNRIRWKKQRKLTRG